MNEGVWRNRLQKDGNLKVSDEFDLGYELNRIPVKGEMKPLKIYKGRVRMYNFEFEVEALDSDDAADKMLREATSNLVVSDMVCLQDEDNKKSIRVVWADQF